ncbi:MAG: acyl carrier protein [Bacteroidia bacterium]|jgi:acyl carrier protein
MNDFTERFNKLLIDKLGVSQEDIQPEAKFTDDLGADSLDMVELIMEFESEFNVSIPDDDTEQIHTVSDAETYLMEKINND